MVQKQTFGEPFFETAYIENEQTVHAEGCCLVVNLDRQGGRSIRIGEELSVAPYGCAVVKDADLSVQGKALLIKNFGDLSLEDLETIDCLRGVWKSARKGYPYYKSPQAELTAGVRVNFCLVSEPNCPSGIHREHAKELDELHVQIIGSAYVDILQENDPDTVAVSLPLVAGSVHAPIWNDDGIYPWHRYRSATRSLFLALEIDR